MDPLTPLVLEGHDLQQFIQYILDKHAASSTLVICSSKDAFMTQLKAALAEPQTLLGPESESELRPKSPLQQRKAWAIPTLRLLASSRTVRLVFCPELAHLRAYLATYAYRQTEQADPVTGQTIPLSDSFPLLAILNPINLHRPTSAHSVQGLNRTFASAVEAAHNTGRRLVFAECTFPADCATMGDPSLSSSHPEHEATIPGYEETNLWDEEVSILNVTTKTFGAGERGWVGRTVSVRRIAGRWCRFVNRNDAGNS